MKKFSILSALDIVFYSLLALAIYFFIVPPRGDQVDPQEVTPSVQQISQDTGLERRVKEIIATERLPYDRFFTSLEGMNGTYSQQFDKFLGLFTCLGLVFLVFQIQLGSQENKRMNEVNDAYKASIERTTAFIGSYEQLIKLKETAQEIEEKRALEERRFQKFRSDRQTYLNAKAMRLVATGVFNVNYGSTFFGGDTVKMFKNFFVEANALISSFSEDEESKKYWNGDIEFLLGLDQFLEQQPVDTALHLSNAIEKTTGFLNTPPTVGLSEVLFPETKHLADNGGVEGWNNKLRSICYFYQGQNQYRLNELNDSQAVNSFECALKFNPAFIDAIFMMFQAKLWNNGFVTPGALTLIDEMKGALESAIEKISNLESGTKMAIQARMFMKFGDFCMVDNKEISTALTHYHESYKLIQQLGKDLPEGYAQVAPMCYFRFAHSLGIAKLKIYDKLDKQILFEMAEKECNLIAQSITNPETRYILFYMLAHCQKELDRDLSTILRSIDEAFKSFEEYCSHLKFHGYSPISNSMLTKTQIEHEMKAFRKLILESRS
ncbi:MAG: hypothetical protein ABMA02_11645 [Saprospiraceae bacterium]